jgi:predicted regulator of Ras-like GTPase activity (Roadblock/LC7/MglB family)
MLATPTVGSALRSLHVRLAGVATVLLSLDGRVISAEVPEGFRAETFAIMCATVHGAAATASAELGRTPPDRIVLEGLDSTVVMVGSGRTGILVSVVDRAYDVSNVVKEMETFATLLRVV